MKDAALENLNEAITTLEAVSCCLRDFDYTEMAELIDAVLDDLDEVYEALEEDE